MVLRVGIMDYRYLLRFKSTPPSPPRTSREIKTKRVRVNSNCEPIFPSRTREHVSPKGLLFAAPL